MPITRVRLIALCLLTALAACRKEKPPPGPPAKPTWTTVSGDGWSISLPGPTSPQTKGDDAGTSALYEVRLADGVYSFAHFSSPALAGGSQNRKALVEATDTELFRKLDAKIVSEKDVKVEAGRPGFTWPARDLVLTTSAGATCTARDLFAREHYFVVTACGTAADAGNGASWAHLRDSLALTLDPMEGVGGVDASSWAAWSPDGKATLRQRASTNARCLLICDRDTKEVWRAEAECRGSSQDAHFVADDCERSVLFYGEPVRGMSLLAGKVVSVYAREVLKYDVVGAAVVKRSDAVARVSHLVQGLGGNSGDKPRYAPDGQSVIFMTVENRKQTVPLSAGPAVEAQDPEPLVAAPVKASPPPPKKKKRKR